MSFSPGNSLISQAPDEMTASIRSLVTNAPAGEAVEVLKVKGKVKGLEKRIMIEGYAY